jgi:hypothetical protein
MQKNFPHGDTKYAQHQSNWREFSFMFLHLTASLLSQIPITHIVLFWRDIESNLAERSRKRTNQISRYYFS